jgi:hypothetical protein
MVSDKNTLLQEEDTSAKLKFMSVGGCTDTPLDLVATGNATGKRRFEMKTQYQMFVDTVVSK